MALITWKINLLVIYLFIYLGWYYMNFCFSLSLAKKVTFVQLFPRPPQQENFNYFVYISQTSIGVQITPNHMVTKPVIMTNED